MGDRGGMTGWPNGHIDQYPKAQWPINIRQNGLPSTPSALMAYLLAFFDKMIGVNWPFKVKDKGQ